MLDVLLVWVLGVILEGASEAAGSQRFPMPVRVLLAGILLVFYFGIAGLMFGVGIVSESTGLVILGTTFFVGFAVLCAHKIRHRRKHR